jgi:hypothetical protein
MCATCARVVLTEFCPTCGERALDERELTLRGFAHQLLTALTSVDGKLLRSFAHLLRRPGDLTVAYLQGQRKLYIGPVPLYLTANVLFFAAESFLGGAVFSTPLASHLRTQPWSDWAQALVAQHVAALGTTVAAYAPIFDSALALHARSWIISMALSFAVLPALVFRRSGRPFVAHAVFSLHLYAFLLLLMCVADIVPSLSARFDSEEFLWRVVDNGVAVLLLLACAVYLFVAARKVYGASGAARVAQVAVLTVGVGAIVLGYRFALFLLTLYTAG